MAFCHLHTHTEYSILDGSNKVTEYVKRVKELGMTACAITDHGVMYGVIDFYKACMKAGIKPIIGCEVYVAPGSRFEKEIGDSSDRYYHLILLAENNTGYQNLSKICSRSFTEGFYYKPRVDRELLKEFHEGIIASSACLAGEVARHIVRGDIAGAEEAALSYEEIFGKGNFFLELQDHGLPDQKTVNAQLLGMSERLHIPLIATNDCHYTYADDAEAHDILLCVQTGKKLSDENRMRYPGGQFYVKSEEEMRSLFPYAQEALDNTQKIADRCNVTIEFGKTKVPHFTVPEGYDSWTYLNHLCDEGYQRYYPHDTDGSVRKQLDYELSVIRRMGYVDYFLIVWDYCNWAREHDIAVGPGRGSAAGSLVSYCTGITKLDPTKYDLLFERFLNPERVSMPDIDVDFEDSKRQLVIQHVVEQYGADHVVRIITYGTMAAKQAIKDVGRVMDLPYAKCDAIAKMITGPRDTIQDSLDKNPDMKKVYGEDPEVHKLIDMAKRLEGLPRQVGIHAAGVVICSDKAENLIPLARAVDGQITTQYEKDPVEELGLLKMDFLGLRNLTVIKDAVRMANRAIQEAGGAYPSYEPQVGPYRITENPEPVLDIDTIDTEDKKVYASIATGRTDGVFQIESEGMKSFMKQLQPSCFDDVVAGIALYRPGPMSFIPRYLEGKNNQEKIHYDTPQLEPILKSTYGCIVYQEQVMQIVQQLAGFSLGRADLMRRAMGHKDMALMKAERENFVYGNEKEHIPGCVGNGISAEVGNQIFDRMVEFAEYAFNKAHSVSYALITYQTAFLKCYYPVEYFASLLSSVIDNPGKLTGYIAAARDLKITILPPDINSGEADFTVSNGSIVYALTAVKSVGRKVIDAIVAEREQNGRFTDLDDFLQRMLSIGSAQLQLSQTAVENLIKAGAFDSFHATRRQMIEAYPQMWKDLQDSARRNMAGQMSLFDIAPDEEKKTFKVRYPDCGEYDRQTLLFNEKEVLGVYVSGHPLEEDEAFWKARVSAKAADFARGEDGKPKVQDRQKVKVGGILTGIRQHYTKKNDAMANLTLEDLTGSLEVVAFPRAYEEARSKGYLKEDAKVFLEGHVQADDEKDAELILDRVIPFDQEQKQIWIQFPDRDTYAQKEKELLQIINHHGGNDVAVVYLKKEHQMRRLDGPGLGLSSDEKTMSLLVQHFGEGNVVLR